MPFPEFCHMFSVKERIPEGMRSFFYRDEPARSRNREHNYDTLLFNGFFKEFTLGVLWRY